MKLLTFWVNGLVKAIKGVIGVIGFLGISVFKFFRFIVVGLYNLIVSVANFLVRTVHLSIYYFKKFFIVPLLPSYKVVFSMYQVIPGIPVNRSDSVHEFEKGHSTKAISFYNSVVKTTADNKIVPSEVYLVKRRRVVARQQFGPVSELKKLTVTI